MKAFMKSLGPSISSKEKLITASLTQKLSESVKDIQMNQSGENLLGVNGGDGSTALCTVLEAIFLHGLKDSLMHIACKAFTTDFEQRPEPSFWSFLLVFSHRQIIDQIQGLPQVTTEVGYCRAWLRIALNDCLLSSYLAAMQRESYVLRQFYKQHAFIRDQELLDVAQNLINGVEARASFNLAINSSLLNYWSHPPLLMAGIWSPPLKSCPISSGVDIAMSLEAPSTSHTFNPYGVSSSSLGPYTGLNEGDALKIILEKSNELKKAMLGNMDGAGTSMETTSMSNSSHAESTLGSSSNTHASSGIGNSLSGVCGWSFEQPESLDAKIRDYPKAMVPVTLPKTIRSLSAEGFAEASYNVLVDSYNLATRTTQDLTIPTGLENPEEGTSDGQRKRSNTATDSLLARLGYEVVSNSIFTLPDFSALVTLVGTIAREQGLDAQKYNCRSCGHSLGISFGRPRLCAFTAAYFCEDCMSPVPHMIPARIIYNWDFRKYAVSKKAAGFLTEFKSQLLINFKILNPNIYAVNEKMAAVQGLRIQLNFLRAYLYTCREPVIEQLQRRVWPREYIYECIHQYSVADLENLQENLFTNQLQQVIDFAREHVTGCWLCSQKGFVCEVCNKPKVLYPFDLDSTFRCDVCNAVYHRGCLNNSQACPKCDRRRKREHLPLLDVANGQPF